jgi:SAM-dependent methyltransferase
MPTLKYYLSRLGQAWSQPGRVLDALAYRLQRSSPWAAKRVATFWDQFAPSIHERWGRGQEDFELLSRIVTDYGARSILDIGCGSGRLFSLFRQLQIHKVLGIDISAKALAVAKRDYPGVPTQCVRLQELSLPEGEFDLIVSNRVLQHIAPEEIRSVMAKLGKISRLIYLNELSESDQCGEQFFMFVHDYHRILGEEGFVRAEGGRAGRTTYALFRRA